MKKPKILFIVGILDSGGVSKAMTSLMNVIDRENYDVSLMILNDEGQMMSLLPDDIRIITNPAWKALVSALGGLPYLLRKKPLLVPGHLLKMVLSRMSKAKAGRLLSRLMPALDEDFDMIVDFQGQHQLYYMVDKLSAPVKITFFHNDYAKWPFYYSADKKYLPKVDHIFTVSENCVKSMQRIFPDVAGKIELMENISSPEIIERLAEEEVDDMRSDVPTFITIGRVTETKGIELGLQAASILKKQGLDFHWYFLGANENADYYNGLVDKYDVKDRITFLGVRKNPYPYMKRATLVVHPSKFEGKSIALDEIKILLKPAVVTNFSTVHDQFEDDYNATICEMTPESLSSSVLELLNSPELQEKYRENLLRDRKDNSAEVEKLYRFLKPSK